MNLKETEQLLIRASAIDSRRLSEPMITAWQEVLAKTDYDEAVIGLVEHRRSQPGVYLEPGHIVQQVRVLKAKHRELYGIHPAPPAGKQWAAEVIESSPRLEVEK